MLIQVSDSEVLSRLTSIVKPSDFDGIEIAPQFYSFTGVVSKNEVLLFLAAERNVDRRSFKLGLYFAEKLLPDELDSLLLAIELEAIKWQCTQITLVSNNYQSRVPSHFIECHQWIKSTQYRYFHQNSPSQNRLSKIELFLAKYEDKIDKIQGIVPVDFDAIDKPKLHQFIFENLGESSMLTNKFTPSDSLFILDSATSNIAGCVIIQVIKNEMHVIGWGISKKLRNSLLIILFIKHISTVMKNHEIEEANYYCHEDNIEMMKFLKRINVKNRSERSTLIKKLNL